MPAPAGQQPGAADPTTHEVGVRPSTTDLTTIPDASDAYCRTCRVIAGPLRPEEASAWVWGHDSAVQAARPASPAQPPADAPTTTETRTEYRLCGVHPHYGHEIADEYDGDDGLRLARDQAQHCIEDGWAEMQIESRTVTTTRTETAWTEAQ